MKVLCTLLLLTFTLWNCDYMTGVPDFSQKTELFCYWTFNQDEPDVFRIGMSSLNKSIDMIPYSEKGYCRSLEWFPGGTHFLYSFNNYDSASLKICNFLDNSVNTVWKSKTNYINKTSISPDGRSIAIALGKLNDMAPFPQGLAVINSDGSGLSVIHDAAISDPQYASADKIFFLSEWILYSISPSGENLTRISPDSIDMVAQYAMDRNYQQVAYQTYGRPHKSVSDKFYRFRNQNHLRY